MRRNKVAQLIVEGKMFEGISDIAKRLVGGLFSGKIKKVKLGDDKTAKGAGQALKNIGAELDKLDKIFDENPEYEELLMKKLREI
jgi:hypothetical protein